jgi:hypothetical protein
LLRRAFLFGWLAFIGCTSLTKDESQIITELNSIDPNYQFSSFGHPSGAYLTLDIHVSPIDSSKISELYNRMTTLQLDSAGNMRTGWSYIIVYNKMGEYLFSVTTREGKVAFIEDYVQ